MELNQVSASSSAGQEAKHQGPQSTPKIGGFLLQNYPQSQNHMLVQKEKRTKKTTLILKGPTWWPIRKKQLENYFTSSDPHHDMSGEGCQVRVVNVVISF